jgi:hypothetical protein
MFAGLIAGRGADAQGISHLVDEWTLGVVIAGSAQSGARTEPIKQLEAVPGRWRNQDKMRKVVMYRKAVWFAFERRVQGHPLKQPESADSAAGTVGAAAEADSAAGAVGAAAGADSAAGAVGAAAGADSAAGAVGAAAGADSAAGAVGAAAGADSAAGAVGSGSAVSSSSIVMTKEEAINDLEVLARWVAVVENETVKKGIMLR